MARLTRPEGQELNGTKGKAKKSTFRGLSHKRKNKVPLKSSQTRKKENRFLKPSFRITFNLLPRPRFNQFSLQSKRLKIPTRAPRSLLSWLINPTTPLLL